MTSDRDTAAGLVNDLLGEEHALPQLVRHGEHDWHIHAVAPDAPLATRIAVEAAMAMIDVIRADEMSRLDVCADPDCEGLVLDLSRNRSRRFCSTRLHQPGRRRGLPRAAALSRDRSRADRAWSVHPARPGERSAAALEAAAAT